MVKVSITLPSSEKDKFWDFLEDLGITPIHIKTSNNLYYNYLDMSEEDVNLFKLCCKGKYSWVESQDWNFDSQLHIHNYQA